jgi:hypothetical protein
LTRVFRRVDAGELLDDEDGHEERRPRAAVLLGDLDAHDAELEAGVDEVARHGRVAVHLRDVRPDPLLRELADLVAEHRFVFGQVGQGQAADGGLGHGLFLPLRAGNGS